MHNDLIVAILIVFIAAVVCIPRFLRRGSVSDAGVRHGLQGCAGLLALIKGVQRHRGMSTAWLSGDKSFGTDMAELRRELEGLFAALLRTADREITMPWPCFTRHEAAVLHCQWCALLDGIPDMTPDQSIARHTHLITKLLGWLAALGEARIELAKLDPVAAGVARNYAQRLPALAECLGQTRAVGSGVAARAVCGPVARVRLMFLTTRAEVLLSQAISASNSSESAAAAQRVEELVGMIRQHILGGASVTIAAPRYFEVATATIDSVFAWIDTCSATLQTDPAQPGAHPVAL